MVGSIQATTVLNIVHFGIERNITQVTQVLCV